MDTLIRRTKTLEQNIRGFRTISDPTTTGVKVSIVEPTSLQDKEIKRSVPTSIDRSESHIETSLDAQE